MPIAEVVTIQEKVNEEVKHIQVKVPASHKSRVVATIGGKQVNAKHDDGVAETINFATKDDNPT